ncbi:hypothetical protein [Phycicoccus sp. 3266]|uniref:hypothetical protein n=1 Tax=Phycicoccus sp. 3266 TaxID=2817751 RepID=UPI0028596BDC|nr:hypothetical protein [Phycicoccus sp. 3266]MDR6861980.1 hypothetical protein [Phycicoccus sp. 3266]
MRRVIEGIARIRDTAGLVVLEAGDGRNGYRLADFSDDEVRWDRKTVTSPWVDGDGEAGPARKQALSKTVAIRVKGATWAEVEQRKEALFDAVAGPFLLERVIEGVSYVWRASAADVSSPAVSAVDVLNRRRVVYLTVPVQPTPAITFPQEP